MAKKSNKSTAKPKRKRVSRPKSQGLGDTIEKVTEATGIKKAVEAVSDALGVDCGCEKRKEWLNERFRYRKVDCMTAEQAATWTSVAIDQAHLTHKMRNHIADVHADLFNHPVEHPCTCSPSEWKRFITEIDELYQAYLADNQE